MRNSLHFATGSDEHETPDDLYDELNKEFRFTRDVCASAENAKHKKYWTKEDNCLTKKWGGRCWMNPPYSRRTKSSPGVYDFVRKASTEVDKGRCELVVCLLAARTDTAWWHEFVWDADKALFTRLLGVPFHSGVEVRFIKGRIKFKGCKDAAPFPSVIAILRRT